MVRKLPEVPSTASSDLPSLISRRPSEDNFLQDDVSELPSKTPDDSFMDHSAASPEPISEQQAKLLQAVGRGYRVRKSYIKPEQLEAHLKEALASVGLDDKHAGDLSHRVAEQALLSTGPEYAGFGKRLIHQDAASQFHFWVSREGDQLKIEIVGQEIGKGSFKTVRAAQEIWVSLAEKQPEFREPTVQVKFAKQARADVTAGIDLLKQRFTPEEIRRFHFAAELTHEDREVSRDISIEGIAAKDTRYAGSFLSLFNEGALDRKAILGILSDVAEGLQALHAKGLVHGDIKPANIYVANDLKEGLIGDFDGLSENGSTSKYYSAHYADDILSQVKGLTPIADTVALAKTFEDLQIQGLPPEFQALLSKVLETNANQEPRKWLFGAGGGQVANLTTQFPVFPQFLDAVARLG